LHNSQWSTRRLDGGQGKHAATKASVPEYYVTLIEHLPEPSVLVAPNSECLVVNRQLGRVAGANRNAPVRALFSQASWEKVEPVLETARSGVLSRLTGPVFDPAGKRLGEGATLTPLRFAGEDQAHVLVQVDVPAARRQDLKDLAPTLLETPSFLDWFPDRVVLIEENETDAAVQARLELESGAPVPVEALGRCLYQCRQGEPQTLYLSPAAPIGSGIHEDRRVTEVRLVPGGQARQAAGTVMAILRPDVPCPTEIEENKRLATLDSLTELINRRAFLQSIGRAISDLKAGKKNGLAILYIDLDEFKKVNDIGGHEAGDIMLLKVAACLRQVAASDGVASRIGGDEFALALPANTQADVYRRADQILDGLDRIRVEVGNRIFTIGASIGAVYVEGLTEDSRVETAELLRLADSACLKGKRLGGRTVHVNKLSDAVPKESESAAPRPPEFSVFGTRDLALNALPIVCLASNEICGEEILLRIGSETEKDYSARVLISAAERDGYIAQVDSWTLDQVMDAASQRTGRRWLTVNVSVVSAADPVFRRVLAYRLRMNPLLATRLCIEISEKDFLREPSTVESFFEFVSGLGCQTAIDDFSGHWSALARFAQMKPDWIKLDAGLLRDIASDDIKLQLFRALTSAVHDLGIKSIAKHVETEDVALVLKTMQVTAAQGYHFGRPVPWPGAERID